MRVKFLLQSEIGDLSKEIINYPLSISSDHTFVFTDVFPNITKDKFEEESGLDFLDKDLYLKVSKITHMRDNKGYYMLINLVLEEE